MKKNNEFCKVEEAALMRILNANKDPITGENLAKRLNANLLSDYTDVNIRAIVKRLRDRGVTICCQGKNGYYLSNDYQDILDQAYSLRDRADAMRNTAEILFNKAQAIKLAKDNGGF